ncbi:hypothetical protein ACM1RC_31960 [Paenibacillus azoreducens]|uniref:hypothetical protein n=1 Tax=Paenibacillus azoreducens TaxID=116718 RepID=UPI0039F5DBFF
MFNRKNIIAGILTWIGVGVIVLGGIFGLMLGVTAMNIYGSVGLWWLTPLGYWVSGFIFGMLFIGLAEVIEQLHKLNARNNPIKPTDSDDFVLLND